MENSQKPFYGLRSVTLLLALAGLGLFPSTGFAQSGTEGTNTIYSSTTTIQPSASFIDARLYTASTDLCSALNTIINSISGSGAVIDARGVSGTALNCGAHTPWSTTPTTSATFSNATILLPPGVITIQSPWLMPSNTRIVGAGAGLTTIQACKSTTTGCSGVNFSGSAMISMNAGNDNSFWGCGGASVCFAVSVTDLTLDAQSLAIDGIDNFNAEELSYVQRVAMANIGGTGLKLSADSGASSSGTSSHSGPYTDIAIGVTSTASACVKVLNIAKQSAEPRGIDGLTCTCLASGTACTNTNAGIYLDGNNVTLKNAFVNGFTDGVMIGDQASASTPVHSNVVVNVSGGASVTNLIHIHKPSDLANAQVGESGGVTVLGATSAANNTVVDDLTNTTLSFSNSPSVGMYVVGDPVGLLSGYPAGYTRFTTSTTVPTWFVGSATVTGSCAAFANGTLYSNTSGTNGGNNTLYACASGVWANVK